MSKLREAVFLIDYTCKLYGIPKPDLQFIDFDEERRHKNLIRYSLSNHTMVINRYLFEKTIERKAYVMTLMEARLMYQYYSIHNECQENCNVEIQWQEELDQLFEMREKLYTFGEGEYLKMSIVKDQIAYAFKVLEVLHKKNVYIPEVIREDVHIRAHQLKVKTYPEFVELLRRGKNK